MDIYITKEIALDAISHAETLSEAFRLIVNQKAAMEKGTAIVYAVDGVITNAITGLMTKTIALVECEK